MKNYIIAFIIALLVAVAITAIGTVLEYETRIFAGWMAGFAFHKKMKHFK